MKHKQFEEIIRNIIAQEKTKHLELKWNKYKQ